MAQQERNAYFFKLTEIKELSRSFWRENLLPPWALVSRWTAGLPCGCRLSGVMLLKFGWQWVHGFNRVTMYFVRRLTLETTRCNIIIIASLWNSTDISAVLPQMGLSNFRAIGNIQTPILRFRYFTKSCGKSSYYLENKSLEHCC